MSMYLLYLALLFPQYDCNTIAQYMEQSNAMCVSDVIENPIEAKQIETQCRFVECPIKL